MHPKPFNIALPKKGKKNEEVLSGGGGVDGPYTDPRKKALAGALGPLYIDRVMF